MKGCWTIDELRRRAARLPRIALTDLPTPFHECPTLAKSIGGRAQLFMKRDDLTGLGLGGNKIRKLEFALGEAKAQGCDVVVQGLAGQSNYCRQTAAAAAKVGLRCILVLRQDHKAEDPPQGNRLLDYVFGAEVRMVPPDPEKQKQALAALLEELKAQGRKPYVFTRRNEVLGAVAYALCLAEIMEQQGRAGAKADYLCVASRGGTLAGLLLGQRLLGFPGKILCILVSPLADLRESCREVAGVATEAADLLGADERFAEDDVHIVTGYAGAAYGTSTEGCLEALLLLGRTEGLVVGPVYTAKCLAGVIDLVRTGKIPAGSTVVFLHTGGVPEVFAYNREIMDFLARAPGQGQHMGRGRG